MKQQDSGDDSMNSKPGDRQSASAFGGLGGVEIFFTVFVTGAAVMVVEILGTRIIAPVFGVNLFVWSALLAVTLCSLAIGYFIGGKVVDRLPRRSVLSLVVLSSAVLVGMIIPLRRPILAMAEGLGFRLGPLVSAAALFVPALLVLGMVGPVAVRLATDDYRTTGRRVGLVYAVSTSGSLLGTLIAAYVLIPAFGTAQIVFGTAVLLAIVGAAPLALRKSPLALIVFVVPILPAVASDPELPAGLSVLARSESPYGLLEVIDDKNRNVRLMRADHSVIGAISLQDHSSAFCFPSPP
jgi:MFS family permease